MNLNENNSGELDVSAEKSANRHVSSAYERGERNSSIALVAAILALAMLTCAVFALFTEESLPVILPGVTTTQPSSGTTTLPQVIKPQDPNKTYPYATKTDKTQFVADEGGRGMYQLDIDSGYAILVNVSDMTTVAHK